MGKIEWDPRDTSKVKSIVQRDIKDSPRLMNFFGSEEIELEELLGGVVSPIYAVSVSGEKIGVVKASTEYRIRSPKGMQLPVPKDSAKRANSTYTIFRNLVPEADWLPSFSHYSNIGNGLLYLSFIDGLLLRTQFENGNLDLRIAEQIGNIVGLLTINSWGIAEPILSLELDTELSYMEFDLKVTKMLESADVPSNVLEIGEMLGKRTFSPVYKIQNPSAKNWIVNSSPYAVDLDESVVSQNPSDSIAELIGDVTLLKYGQRADPRIIDEFVATYWNAVASHISSLPEFSQIAEDVSRWVGLKMLYRGPWSVSPYNWINEPERLKKDSIEIITGQHSPILK